MFFIVSVVFGLFLFLLRHAPTNTIRVRLRAQSQTLIVIRIRNMYEERDASILFYVALQVDASAFHFVQPFALAFLLVFSMW